ncbi:MAG: sugar phosphate isomerase/epimerase [Kiritimatiellae bacterium]|nr:sugar phosphate isomerase/epimerase [Kiritimatiellia bacterium]
MKTASQVKRREFLACVGLSVGATATFGSTHEGKAGQSSTYDAKRFRFSLNPATVRPYKLSLREQIEIAIAAGYDGIEPWVSDIQKAKEKGELPELRTRCKDSGLALVNAIGFAPWAVSDPAERSKGLESMKCDMALVAELGCTRIAAPPSGITGQTKIPLEILAERYRAVLELGASMGVRPLLEFWGASANLSRLDEAIAVAAASEHRDAAVLADVYHTYRGGCSVEGFRFLTAATLPVLHLNDYPASPERTQQKDADRVWPGDGIAPWRRIFEILRVNSCYPWLSLELFHAAYCQTTPLETVRTGLEKMRKLIATEAPCL